jgi:hypothetical protein
MDGLLECLVLVYISVLVPVRGEFRQDMKIVKVRVKFVRKAVP